MNPQQLEAIIGYKFQNTLLFTTALTHRSFLNESNSAESNERLEFLGDAVLELIVSDYLYQQRPGDPEGVLTAARSAIVRTESLAEVARTIKLGEFLLMSKGEEKSGGRTNQSLLADATESLIGGIFLDGGYQKAVDFFHSHLVPKAEVILKLNLLKDPKSLLQEKIQDKGFPSPIYKTISQAGPDHDRVFTVGVFNQDLLLATGSGKSKQSAQQSAAQNAIDKLETILDQAKID
jgi:ribonuclease-3